MKSPIAMTALALVGTIAAPIVLAQMPAPAPRAPQPATRAAEGLRPVASVPKLTPTGTAKPANNPNPATTKDAASSSPAKKDVRVYEASTSLPAPSIPDEPTSPNFALPTDPIEPYLLTRNVGPFLVMAKTFKGPDAERWALALVLELRKDYGLPAFIMRTRDIPMRSNIRNVPPTAIREVEKPYLTEPEKGRTHDEAMVLVGDEKTLQGSEELLHKVKKIKPRCLNEMPKLFHWRKGLDTAWRTTNPFVPAQDLFPRKPDVFVQKMNGGAHSINRCPGQYTLQVAEFGGRATFNAENPSFEKKSFLEKSPLAEAYDKAERLAETLAKNPEIKKIGALPYVVHDRTSSKVVVGAFNAPNDPKAVKVRETLLKLAVDLTQDKDATMIVPAPALTDVAVLRAQAQ